MRPRLFAIAGYTTTFMGPGRPEFRPATQPPFETYLTATAAGTAAQLPQPVEYDEGVIGSFMAARFLHQANLPGFLPFMAPSLLAKPCIGVEGACGTGGRAIGVALRSLWAQMADIVFVAAFEIQNTKKALYGADILAGAAHYGRQRKEGHAFFFPALFDRRAAAYFERYGKDEARRAMATWYAQGIYNARKNPKAQEHYNKTPDPYALAMTPPDPARFLPHLTPYDCSKVSDGACSCLLVSEEGLARCGLPVHNAVEIIALAEAQGDITVDPADPACLATTAIAIARALQQAALTIEDIGILEVHDCFSITALLALEASGVVAPGGAARYILDGQTGPQGRLPTNLSGGLMAFGHPTGASGVRQLVDLLQQLTGQAAHQITLRTPYGMLISMGGDDKTVTCLIVKAATA